MRKLFVSYRRDDTADFVDQFVDSLEACLPGYEIFRDIGGIKVAEDWVDKLRDQIDRSGMVLLLIGAKWMQAGRDGRRRIDDPRDILRREIEWAHERGVTVTPVLVGSAPMPKEAELPASIRFVHRQQAQRIRDESFDVDVDALAARLREWFDEGERRGQREQEEADAFLDEIDDGGKLEIVPGVFMDDFAVVGNWTCEVASAIVNDPGFASNGRATIRFRIPATGGTFKGTWKSKREFRIEGNWSIGAADPSNPRRVTSLRLEGLGDGVDRFAWEIPIDERVDDGYRGVDAQGRQFFARLVQPPKRRF